MSKRQTSEATPQPASKQRRDKRTMVFNEQGVDRLNARKHLEEINAERRSRGQKEVSQFLVWDEKARNGLALLVGARTKTFRLQFKLHGEWISHTIGRFGEMTVTEAKVTAEKWRRLAAEGIDPRQNGKQQHEQSPKQPLTYGKVVDEFIEHYAKPQQRTWDQTQRVLKTTCAAWLEKPINQIAPNEVRALLRGFIADGQPYKAAVTKRWLAKLWRWAYDEDHVSVPLIKGLNNVKIEERERDRVYSDHEISVIWKAASQLADSNEAAFVRLLVLLAPRKTALACLQRSHLDDPDNPSLWTTPFELTKSRKTSKKKRVYLTPLPPLAQRIVKDLLRDGRDRLFPTLPVYQSDGGISRFHGGDLKDRLVELGVPADFHYHAFRHTIATYLQNQGVAEWERGLVLNHSGSGSVTAGYSHGYPLELKRTLLSKWADHVEALVGSNVVALTARRGAS